MCAALSRFGETKEQFSMPLASRENDEKISSGQQIIGVEKGRDH